MSDLTVSVHLTREGQMVDLPDPSSAKERAVTARFEAMGPVKPPTGAGITPKSF